MSKHLRVFNVRLPDVLWRVILSFGTLRDVGQWPLVCSMFAKGCGPLQDRRFTDRLRIAEPRVVAEFLESKGGWSYVHLTLPLRQPFHLAFACFSVILPLCAEGRERLPPALTRMFAAFAEICKREKTEAKVDIKHKDNRDADPAGFRHFICLELPSTPIVELKTAPAKLDAAWEVLAKWHPGEDVVAHMQMNNDDDSEGRNEGFKLTPEGLRAAQGHLSGYIEEARTYINHFDDDDNQLHLSLELKADSGQWPPMPREVPGPV